MSKVTSSFLSYIDTLETMPKTIAAIRETECIGCAKCIQACPVDAILGSGKQMHTVLMRECTGCELCIAPCPVDCIDMIPSPIQENSETQKNHFQKRYLAREERTQKEKIILQKKNALNEKKAYIKSAIARVNSKKNSEVKDNK